MSSILLEKGCGNVKAEIISVGTELLLGQIANTNAQYLSKRLAELGIDVYYHTAVGDNGSRLKQVIQTAQERSQIILFTGGLGPTKDDLTKETIATVLGKTLVEHQPSMENIEHFFKQRGIEMTANNRKQAHIVEGSTVLPNDHGMAPGMAIQVEDIHYLLFPGPPRELIPMFDQYAIPYLQSLYQEQFIVHSNVIRFFGIGESLLEEKLMDLIDSQSNPTIAPLANEAEATIRLTAKARNLEEANQMIVGVENEIEARVGQFIYGYNDDSLASVVSSLLREKGLKLAVAESCTGGLVSQMLTSLPGSSKIFAGSIVSYSSHAKINVLGVAAEIIAETGTVSTETAEAMAVQTRKQFEADVAVSITGVAGPDPTENKPVGTVFIGLATEQGCQTFSLQLSGSRPNIQLRAAKYALFYVYQWLNRL